MDFPELNFFDIPINSKILILGSRVSGKTTIANALARRFSGIKHVYKFDNAEDSQSIPNDSYDKLVIIENGFYMRKGLSILNKGSYCTTIIMSQYLRTSLQDYHKFDYVFFQNSESTKKMLRDARAFHEYTSCETITINKESFPPGDELYKYYVMDHAGKIYSFDREF